MTDNGDFEDDADSLAKSARISQLADSEEYKLDVFQRVERAYILSFITRAQRDTIFAILFVGERTHLNGGPPFASETQ